MTENGDYIFRVCFIDPFQGTVMAKFAAQNLGFKRVAILKDVKNDYSVGLAQYFTEEFTGAQGGTIVGEQAYSEGDPDFRAQLTAIKANNPEAIFVPGYYTEVGLDRAPGARAGHQGAAARRRRLGLGPAARDRRRGARRRPTTRTTSRSTAPTPALQKFVDRVQGEVQRRSPTPSAASPTTRRTCCSTALKRLHADDPAAFEALDAAKAGDAEAQKAARAKLRDLIAATQDFPGVTGPITLDADRNAVKPAVVIKVEGRRREVRRASIAPLSACRSSSSSSSTGSRGGVYALIALGYTMVYGILRLINFAHGDVFMLGAFVAYYSATQARRRPRRRRWAGARSSSLISMVGCASSAS